MVIGKTYLFHISIEVKTNYNFLFHISIEVKTNYNLHSLSFTGKMNFNFSDSGYLHNRHADE